MKNLWKKMLTPGRDVVWLMIVEPVGAKLLGYYDLYLFSLGGGTYSFGIRL